MSLLSLANVSRTYEMGAVRVHALRNVSMAVEEGEFVAILGPSGSYQLAGTPVASLPDDRLAAIRSRTIGFVFQSYNLLPRTSAIDNVATPLLYQGVPRRERVTRAREALELLGLGDRLRHEPTELSGGEQQRVAVARAIVTDPALVLADEPTGNLDTKSGGDVLDVLRGLHAGG